MPCALITWPFPSPILYATSTPEALGRLPAYFAMCFRGEWRESQTRRWSRYVIKKNYDAHEMNENCQNGDDHGSCLVRARVIDLNRDIPVGVAGSNQLTYDTKPLCKARAHDDVIKWKHSPRCWPFVWGIHRSPANSPRTGPVTRSYDDFFDLRLKKQLSIQSLDWWFETPSHPLWRHCNVIYHQYLNFSRHMQSPWLLESKGTELIMCGCLYIICLFDCI